MLFPAYLSPKMPANEPMAGPYPFSATRLSHIRPGALHTFTCLPISWFSAAVSQAMGQMMMVRPSSASEAPSHLRDRPCSRLQSAYARWRQHTTFASPCQLTGIRLAMPMGAGLCAIFSDPAGNESCTVRF